MTRIVWHGDAAAKAILDAAFKGLVDAGEFILEEANRTVPIETGTLKGSGDVTPDRANLQVVVSYDTPYAVRVHEDTSARHDNGRRAKWLERTMNENARGVLDHIEAAARRAI